MTRYTITLKSGETISKTLMPLEETFGLNESSTSMFDGLNKSDVSSVRMNGKEIDLDYRTFTDCPSLTSVQIDGELRSVEHLAFPYDPNMEISYHGVTFPADRLGYHMEDDVLFNLQAIIAAERKEPMIVPEYITNVTNWHKLTEKVDVCILSPYTRHLEEYALGMSVGELVVPEQIPNEELTRWGQNHPDTSFRKLPMRELEQLREPASAAKDRIAKENTKFMANYFGGKTPFLLGEIEIAEEKLTERFRAEKAKEIGKDIKVKAIKETTHIR